MGACGDSIMKVILVVVNLIFTILGLAALIIGIIAMVDKDKLSVFSEIGEVGKDDYNVTSLLRSGAIVLIVGGVIIMLIGALGMFGACKRSRPMLMLYAVFVGLVFIIEVVAVILAGVFYGKVSGEAKEFLTERLKAQYDGTNTGDPFTVAVNSAQVKFSCCGINNYMDYMNTTKWMPTNDTKVPLTCCKLKDPGNYLDNPSDAQAEDPNCQMAPTSTNSWMNKGCYSEIENFVKQNAGTIIGIGVAILVVEVLCIIFACCLAREVADE